MPTLVCNPLALLNSLGPSAQSHEVTLHNVLRILGIEPEWKRPRQVVGGNNLIATGQGATRVVHANGLGE